MIGGSPARVGGLDRVTGRQAYVADIHLDGELFVKLVTVDHARFRIDAIDASAALAVPGVRAVLTAADLPRPMPRFGPTFQDRPVLAVGETHYHGEPVAAVAAETLDAAEAGAALVRVDGEPLRAVVTIADALAPDAPLVQDPSLRPDDRLAGTNVLREHRYGWGDVDAAAADAEVVVEGTYYFPMVTQFAIEPHAFMAAPDGDGIAIWSSIQHPYWLQRVMAGVLDLPLEKVRIYAPDPGGAFGGKQHAKYEPLVAFLALRTGRPCRLVLTLEETFQAVRRGASEVHVRTGFRRDGTIVFRDIHADYLIGAYADIADRTVGKGSFTSNGPYAVPAVRIRARSVLSHTVPSTAFRGFGNPQQIWAVESNLDEAARVLAIDPVELRLRNLAPRGYAFIAGDTPADGDWAMSLRRAAEMIGWGEPTPPGRGRGIAVGLKAGPTTGLSQRDRPAAGRRQRRPVFGHVRHGPGRPHDLRPDRRRGARRAGRPGHGRHGRHGHRPLRPADVGQPVDGDHGSRDPARLRRHPRRKAAPRRLGSTARSSVTASSARRATRTTRSAGRRRSSSSTRPRSRSRSIARPAT